jgi:hypothetical protein
VDTQILYSSALKNWHHKTSGDSRAHVDLLRCARSPLVLRANSPNHLSILSATISTFSSSISPVLRSFNSTM